MMECELAANAGWSMAVCQGCGEEYVCAPRFMTLPGHCEFCATVKRALEMDYRQISESTLFGKLPRTKVGVVPVESVESIEEAVCVLTGREIALVAAAFVAPLMIAAGFVAWYGIRLVCQAGLWFADWVSR